MIMICKTYDKDIFSKFAKDENGLFYNERLEKEVQRRKNYSASRSKNRSGESKVENISVTYDEHMETKTNSIYNNIIERKEKFKKTLEPFKDIYHQNMIQDFYEYWTEPNRAGTKFRQESEKTWDIVRRLKTWDKNSTKSNFSGSKNKTPDNANFFPV
jgi:hypothetical protein